MSRLEFPNESHRAELARLWQEWRSVEWNSDFLDGLVSTKALEELIKNGWIEATGTTTKRILLLTSSDTNRILGITRIRANITDPEDISSAGHIASGIRPSERGNGWWRKILELSLLELQRIGLSRALITCHENNIRSRKTIEACGGMPDGYNLVGERRYWIDLESQNTRMINIDTAGIEDYESVRPLFEEIHTCHACNAPWKFERSYTEWCSPKYYASLIEDQNTTLLLAKTTQGETVGFIVLRIKEAAPIPNLVPRKYFLIDNVWVKSSHRWTWIGSQLMDRAEEIAKSSWITEIELNVWGFNESAIEFYDRRGFETITRQMRKVL